MRIRGSYFILGAALLAIPCTQAYAQQDRDRDYQDRDRDRDHDRDRDDARRHFTDRDRQVLREWYRDHADRFEPEAREQRWNNEDLERRLQPGSPMDDEIGRWSRPVSEELNDRLDRLPEGWQYRRIGYHVCILDRDGTIRDVYHFDQFGDRDRDVIRDWNRDHQNAVNQFLGGFGVRTENEELERRLQVGNVVDGDLQNHARPAPEDLVERLTPAPRDWHYVVIGDRLCLVDRDWRIHESFRFQH